MEERVLSGRYRLVGHLARGGMAEVYRGEDTLLNRAVAVKVLHANFAADEAFVTRFRREAQAAANLSHPNIVAIYDWGQDGDTYYMVMELIEGRTLRDILRSEGPLLPRRAAEIAAEAAAALTVAHRAGVFHRDVKPGNIMITREGGVKVTDFGIARALDDSEELTRTGAVIGTATYFSPEQAQGLPADERSDVYSLGVVLYEMLTGRPPFTGDSPVAVAYQHVSEHAPTAAELNPEVSEELSAIVERAMAKDPADRYQSAEEFRSDLLAYLAGGVPAAVGAAAAAAPTTLLPPPPTVPPDETARLVAPPPPPDEPSRAGYFAAVGGLLVVFLIGVAVLVRLLTAGSPPTTVVVPDVSAMPEQDASIELQRLDLKVKKRLEPSESVPAGFVIRTDPPTGTEVEAGEFVTMVVSEGTEEFAVPPVVGDTEQIARARIEAQGFEVGLVTYEETENLDEGVVIRQSPEAGTKAAPGTEIDLVVSSGPSSLTVPNVAGLSAENAQLQLTKDGFVNIELVEEFSPDVLAGFVVRTEPVAGDLVPREATITLYVSKGPEPVAVPGVVGMTPDEAEAALEAVGLVAVVDPVPVEVSLDSGLVGRIVEQDPAAGVTVELGSEVMVRVGVVRKVVVPDLSGLTLDEARAAAATVGLTVVELGTLPNDDPAKTGTVLDQDPTPGTEVEEGTAIGVFVAEEPPPTTTTTTTSSTTTTTAGGGGGGG